MRAERLPLRYFLGAGAIGVVLFVVLFAIVAQRFFSDLPPPIPTRDHGYVAVYTLVSIMYLGGTCQHIDMEEGHQIQPGLVKCEDWGGHIKISNLRNGTVLKIDEKFELKMLDAADGRRIVVDVANGYLFLTSAGVITNFRRAKDFEVTHFAGLPNNATVCVSDFFSDDLSYAKTPSGTKRGVKPRNE